MRRPSELAHRRLATVATRSTGPSDFVDPESQQVLTAAACALARELAREAARERFKELLDGPKVP